MFIHFLIKITLLSVINARQIQDFLTKNSSRLWLQNETQWVHDAENRYCSICCVDINQVYKGRKCGIHTLCAYASKHVGEACKGLIVMDFSQVEIDAIVDAHNTVRNRIAMGLEEEGDPGPQPSASNMKLISWDTELAEVASRWATQCVFANDKCRDLDRFPVGQIISRGTYATKTDLEHIADWYEFVQYSTEDILKSYDPQKNGDLAPYIQLVWADTYLIGCARVSFQQLINGRITYREHFFCNYGPAGNIPHQSVYKFGEPCSACSEGTFCTNPEYPGLCGNENLNASYLKSQRKKHVKQVEIASTNLSKQIQSWFAGRLLMLILIWLR